VSSSCPSDGSAIGKSRVQRLRRKGPPGGETPASSLYSTVFVRPGSQFSCCPSSAESIRTTVNLMSESRVRVRGLSPPYSDSARSASAVEKREIREQTWNSGTAPYELYAMPPSSAPSPEPNPQWMLSMIAFRVSRSTEMCFSEEDLDFEKEKRKSFLSRKGVLSVHAVVPLPVL
jgi:hypothetical protein